MKLTMRVRGTIVLAGALATVSAATAADEVAPDAPDAPVAPAAPVAVVAETAAPVDASVATTSDSAARSPEHALLLRAIGERRLLHFTYAGHPRVVEPYAYGVSATGEAVLHGYQVAGGSTSKPPPGWRTFAVSGISEVVETERRFSKTREDYSTERPKLDPQWAEVEGVKSEE